MIMKKQQFQVIVVDCYRWSIVNDMQFVTFCHHWYDHRKALAKRVPRPFGLKRLSPSTIDKNTRSNQNQLYVCRKLEEIRMDGMIFIWKIAIGTIP